jgi:hypothetical protein
VSSNTRPGHSAGYGMSPTLRACGLRVHGPPKPRTSIASDLRQEPGAGKPHAGICAGGPGQPGPLPLQSSRFVVQKGLPLRTRRAAFYLIEKIRCFPTLRLSHFWTPR